MTQIRKNNCSIKQNRIIIMSSLRIFALGKLCQKRFVDLPGTLSGKYAQGI